MLVDSAGCRGTLLAVSEIDGAEQESTSAGRSGELPALETALETAPPGGPLARRKSSAAATAPRCAAPNAVVKSAPVCGALAIRF